MTREPDPFPEGKGEPDGPLEPERGRRVSVTVVRNVGLCLLAVAVVAIGVALWRYALSQEPVTLPSQQPPPPVAVEPLTPTDLQQVKSAEGLGPFVHIAVNPSTPTPDTSFPAVLLIGQDGSVHASQKWQVPFADNDPLWMSGDTLQKIKPMSPLIQELSVQNGFATFKANNRTYTIRCGQAFLFEQEPQTVIVIDAVGAQHFTTTHRAQLVRKSL